MDDKRLAQKLKRGDRMALNRIMERFTPYLSTVVWNVMGSAAPVQDVEEVVSDTFLSLWTHRDTLDPAKGMRSWLAAAARNRAIDRMRASPPPPLPLEDTGPARSWNGALLPRPYSRRWRRCPRRTTRWCTDSIMRRNGSETSPGTWGCPSRRRKAGFAGHGRS